MTGAADIRRERGSAMVAAIAMMVLGALLIAAVFSIMDRSDERSKSRAQRAANIAVIDHALASYEYALESNMTDESAGFLLNQAALTKLAAARPGMQPVANSSFGADFTAKGLKQTRMPNAATQWTMRVDQPDGTIGWWQPLAVLPPRGGSPNLILYLRTWVSTGDQNSRVIGDSRLIRADLRPGRFSDYQMLVDGPITLGDGLTVNGRIHTNGYPDAYLVDQLVSAGRPMKLYSGNPTPPTCTAGAGFSTAAGLIENKGGCAVASGPQPKYLENTGERYDLLRGSNHLAMLEKLCGSRVRCGAGNGPWNVTLSGSTLNASSPGGSLSVNAAGGAVVLLKGRVRLSGMLTGGQLTLGVGNAGGFNVNGSASVELIGNGTIGASTAGNSVFGLVVEGDVIPAINEGSCPAGLNAAVVSASGTLGIPPQYRVPVPQSPDMPHCNNHFKFVGSLGTHYMPLMRLVWNPVYWVGYKDRSYAYDPRLLETAPPMFPTTGPWQASTWKDADPRCLSTANITDAECG